MMLRGVTGAGTAFSFMVVATFFLGTVLVGWRAMAMLIAGWRLRRPAVHENA